MRTNQRTLTVLDQQRVYCTSVLSLVDKVSEGSLEGTCTGENGRCSRRRCSSDPVWWWWRGYHCRV